PPILTQRVIGPSLAGDVRQPLFPRRPHAQRGPLARRRGRPCGLCLGRGFPPSLAALEKARSLKLSAAYSPLPFDAPPHAPYRARDSPCVVAPGAGGLWLDGPCSPGT